MLRLLQFLILGHVHKWETVKNVRITYTDVNAEAFMYVCRCETCGRYKRFKVSP